MFSKRNHEYTHVKAADYASSDSDVEQTWPKGSTEGCNCGRRKSPSIFTLTSVALNVLAAAYILYAKLPDLLSTRTLNQEIRAMWAYSPVHDMVDLELAPATINGSLLPTESASIARQMPNPESDALWEEWELTRMLPITREQVVKLGKDPETAVKLEDSLWGLGDDAYAAQFDVFHQLHCLNSFRQIAYGSYYNRSMVDPHPEKPRLKEIHLNHCVDILMQAIQCSGNVNLITMHWVETQTYPFPDMSVNRQCINFEKLTEWRRDNTIDMEHYVDVMKKPEGVKEKPMIDAFFKLQEIENPHPDLFVPDGSV